jgi:hypothetical protein
MSSSAAIQRLSSVAPASINQAPILIFRVAERAPPDFNFYAPPIFPVLEIRSSRLFLAASHLDRGNFPLSHMCSGEGRACRYYIKSRWRC